MMILVNTMFKLPMLQPVELNLAKIFVAINTLLRDTYTNIH